MLHAARLYRAGKAPVIVISGGHIPWLGSNIPEARSIQSLLEEWDVPRASIIAETASRNTYENAMLTKELLAERGLHRVLLVTSAWHMPRALATFKSAGINAIPAATDFRVTYQDRRMGPTARRGPRTGSAPRQRKEPERPAGRGDR